LREAAVIKAEAEVARTDAEQRAANLEQLVGELTVAQAAFQPQLQVTVPQTEAASV